VVQLAREAEGLRGGAALGQAEGGIGEGGGGEGDSGCIRDEIL
jgi:hypothetical protein